MPGAPTDGVVGVDPISRDGIASIARADPDMWRARRFMRSPIVMKLEDARIIKVFMTRSRRGWTGDRVAGLSVDEGLLRGDVNGRAGGLYGRSIRQLDNTPMSRLVCAITDREAFQLFAAQRRGAVSTDLFLTVAVE